MAQTTQVSIDATIPELWAAELLAEAENQTFWYKFEGAEGSSMPIIRKDDLSKSAGDKINFDLVLALTGAGVTGDTNLLSGNEEALKFRQNSLTVSDWSYATRSTWVAKELSPHDLRGTMLRQQAKRVARKLDVDMWNILVASGSVTGSGTWHAGSGADAINEVVASGYPSLDEISELKAVAQVSNKIEPLRVDGDDNEYFALVMHPFAFLGLRKTAAWQQAQRDANVRGNNNPLFTGAKGEWDGVLIYTSNSVPVGTSAGSGGANVAYNIFFGQQAAMRGYAQYPDWVEEEFDYGRSFGVATKMIKGEGVSRFDFSAAGDGSGYRSIGHMLYVTSAVGPTN